MIANPILYSGVTSLPNNDPDNTSENTLIRVNSNQRIQTGLALKQATIQYFNTVNAALLAPSRTDGASLSYILNYDYGVFNQTATLRLGAGNYTPAFGLLTGVNYTNALDVSDTPGRSNSIVQLNGVYKSTTTTGCQLSVGYDGKIQLSQGSQVYEAIINREFSDSLTRTTGNQYLLNVASPSLTSPRFIQINTVGAVITSANAGSSGQQTPITLDTTDLSCTF